jgi:hypothetical protein
VLKSIGAVEMRLRSRIVGAGERAFVMLSSAACCGTKNLDHSGRSLVRNAPSQ